MKQRNFMQVYCIEIPIGRAPGRRFDRCYAKMIETAEKRVAKL